MDDIYYKLAEVVNLSYKDSSDYLIAKMMLLKLQEIPEYTIDIMASICYTSTASITRFCQKIGYNSFKEFKKSISYDVQYFMDMGDVIHKKVNMNTALVSTKLKYDYLTNYASSVIMKLDISELVEQIIKSKSIIIVCATKELTAMNNFQALLHKYNKRVDVLVCNSDPSKLDYIIDETSLALVATYDGRWVNRSRELISKIRQRTENVVALCLTDTNIKKFKFSKYYTFDINRTLDLDALFFLYLFYAISEAITLYYQKDL